MDLLALDVQLDIARTSTQAYQRTYDLLEDRFRGGTASTRETSRALGDAQAAIPRLESPITAKENQISILLGRAPGPIPPGPPMYAQPIIPVVPAGLPSTLLDRRSDLRGAEQQLVAANARIGVATADFFPRVNITTLFGTASPEVSALTGGTATIWAVAGAFSGRCSTLDARSGPTARPSRRRSRRAPTTSRRSSSCSARCRTRLPTSVS